MGAPSTARRPLYLTLDADDVARLHLAAARRGQHVADFLSWLVHAWLQGPGRAWVAAGAAGEVIGSAPAARRRRGQTTGQLRLVDDGALDPPPF